MKCSEIIKYLENWTPKEIAWQKDNVGLQIGTLQRKIKNILLCLELTDDVVKEAIKEKCNLIISHHPLLFHPLKKINLQNDKTSKLVEILIKNDINLYSVHTNLDFTKDGVSFQLAKTLGLKNINFLVTLKSNLIKLIVYTPEAHAEKIANIIFNEGGGSIGNYSSCSFRSKGEGTFKGMEFSNPAVGKKNILERVHEIKLEVLIDSWKLNSIMNAVRKAHPYEEVAYDAVPLANENSNFGIGAVGEFENDFSADEFLNHTVKKLKSKGIRYTKGKKNKIRKVAVCGGSGSEFIREAVNSGADAYVTADIKYHNFHDAYREIFLIDAGHYETEIHSLTEVQKRLKSFINKKENIKVFKYSGSTNPIFFYNN